MQPVKMNRDTETSSPAESCRRETDQNLNDSFGRNHLKDFVERRDQNAFGELVRLHGPLVYGVCRRVVGSHHDAQDAFQATFLILSQKASSIRKREMLSSWLYGVAYQVSLRAKAILNRRRIRERQMHDDQEFSEPAPGLWKELEPILDEELNSLSDKYRIPVLLCDLQGRTQKDAACALGWSEGTLSTRLTKARAILAQRLRRRGITLSTGALALLIAEGTSSAALPPTWIATTLKTTTTLATTPLAHQSASLSKIATLAKDATKVVIFSNLNIVVAAGIISALGLVFTRTDSKAVVAAEITLPPEVQRDLEENARQLNPITISYTKQLKSLLPEQETFNRLELAADRSRDFYFDEFVHRVILNGENFYTSVKFPVVAPLPAEKRGSRGYQLNEKTFDGKVLCEGQIIENGNEGVLAKDTEASYSARNVNRTVRDAFSSPYFTQFSGLTFPLGKERAITLSAESEIMGELRQGGKLISVENVQLDNRPHLRVALTVENKAKTIADKMDTKAVQKGCEQRRESPERTRLVIDRIFRGRKLPPTKKLVYYLDPELHHALRRSEEWYEPDRLLSRCDRSDFEQVSGRQLWLPMKCEVEHHTFSTAPGILIDGSFLHEFLVVTEISIAPPPENQFTLNYTNSGILVYDETGLDSDTNSGDLSVTHEPYMTGSTYEETLRNKIAAQKQSTANQIGRPENEIVPQSNGTQIIRWVLLVNVVFACVIGIIFGYRRFVRS